jgi:hypothetical protein
MRKFILFVTLLLTSIITLAQEIKLPAEGKAVVYFARVSALGFAINFTYFDSTQLIGKFNGTGYIRYECDPGKHVFWARSENRSFVEADLEAGKIYFIEAIPQMGALKAGVDLEPIDPAEDEKRVKKILKLLNRKTAESLDADQLAAETKKMDDVMHRGWEKYKKDKQEGRIFSQLITTMNYMVK